MSSTESEDRERRALITGIAGQDGGYLAEQLLADGYRVWGLVRSARRHLAEAQPWLAGVEFLEGDLSDSASLRRAIESSQPGEVYNLASYSQPGRAWSEPEASADVNALGPLRLLEAIREVGGDWIRFCQASTSEMFASDAPNPQNETTPLAPRSPYGAAKAYAHNVTGNYRDRYGIFACSAILYNHESPRRGPEFVTRKITLAAARIRLGLQREIALGSLTAGRDWGYAPDFVRAMRLMLRADGPGDYVIGTGKAHSVGEFLRIAFEHVGLDPAEHVVEDPEFTRRADPVCLEADPSRARDQLGWTPSIDFRTLVEMMVDADLERESRAVSQAGRAR